LDLAYRRNVFHGFFHGLQDAGLVLWDLDVGDEGVESEGDGLSLVIREKSRLRWKALFYLFVEVFEVDLDAGGKDLIAYDDVCQGLRPHESAFWTFVLASKSTAFLASPDNYFAAVRAQKLGRLFTRRYSAIAASADRRLESCCGTHGQHFPL